MWEMGKKKEGEAWSFVCAIGLRLPATDMGWTEFPSFPHKRGFLRGTRMEFP